MRVACHVLCALLCCVPSAVAQQSVLPLPETGASVSITLAARDQTIGGFRQLTIVSHARSFHFAPRRSIKCIPTLEEARLESGMWDRVDGFHLDKSRCFFDGKYGNAPHLHTLLAFVGEPGIGAAPLFLVGFTPDGTPYKVLERDELDLTSLQTINVDSARLAGKATLSQVMGGEGGNGSTKPYATTYDPTAVYVLHAGSTAKYSLEETRIYNRQHYVWAGPRTREDYAVVYNLPGHRGPLGVPAAQLDRVLKPISNRSSR